MSGKKKTTVAPTGKGGEVVSKTRISFAYTEYVVKGEGFKAVIHADDDAYEIGQSVSIK